MPRCLPPRAFSAKKGRGVSPVARQLANRVVRFCCCCCTMCSSLFLLQHLATALLLLLLLVSSFCSSLSSTTSSSIQQSVSERQEEAAATEQPLVPHQQGMTLSVVEVGVEEIVLEWHCEIQVVTCTARYGLLTPDHHYHQQEDRWWRFEQTQVVELDHFVPSSKRFQLKQLVADTSYVFEMLCRTDGRSHWLKSKPIFFTTTASSSSISSSSSSSSSSSTQGGRQTSSLAAAFAATNDVVTISPLRYRGPRDWEIDEPIRWTTKRRNEDRPTSPYASYSIALGIVCGIVAFLIINVTIVQLLRYRNRQSRIRQLRFIYGDSAEHYYDVT